MSGKNTRDEDVFATVFGYIGATVVVAFLCYIALVAVFYALEWLARIVADIFEKIWNFVRFLGGVSLVIIGIVAGIAILNVLFGMWSQQSGKRKTAIPKRVNTALPDTPHVRVDTPTNTREKNITDIRALLEVIAPLLTEAQKLAHDTALESAVKELAMRLLAVAQNIYHPQFQGADFDELGRYLMDVEKKLNETIIHLRNQSSGSKQERAESSAPKTPPAQSNVSSAATPYDILGIQKGATAAEIKKAYHNMMFSFHQDRFPPDKEKQQWAKEKCQKISAAYRALQSQGRV